MRKFRPGGGEVRLHPEGGPQEFMSPPMILLPQGKLTQLCQCERILGFRAQGLFQECTCLIPLALALTGVRLLNQCLNLALADHGRGPRVLGPCETKVARRRSAISQKRR